ncbi:MAG TPA: M56 family metallopeptidase [Gemmataceae bacterium]|jgi:beta-lactamase regulating signal transducer with metallopeptidase domain|nr:M56 family metallopeptidase [Gemmataceae bacterium]
MFWWLGQNLVTAAVLACLVAALCRLGRFRPAVRHALWLVVLLKLLVPPLVNWPWAVPEWLPQERGGAASVEYFTVPEAELGSCTRPVEVTATPPGTAENMAGITARADKEALRLECPAVAAPWWQSPLLGSSLAGTWLAGTALVALAQLVRILRFRRLSAHGKRAPRCLARQVDDLAGRLHVRPPITRLVARLSSPFVWGLGRAKLLWPALLMHALPAHCRRSVIAHELAHLRRRDHWVSWLEIIAACVWWWNPLFWYVRRQLRLNAELACDAWVIGTLPDERRSYAEALIEVTQYVSQTAAPVPALGMNGSARQVFERRLTMIMRDHIPHRMPYAGALAIALLALLAIPGWSQVQRQKPDAAPRQDSKELNIELVYPAKDLTIPIEIKPSATARFDQEIVLQLAEDVAADRSVSDAEREKRLQALEQQIQRLLREVQALRKSSKPALSPPHVDAADVRLRATRTLGALQISSPKPADLRRLAVYYERVTAKQEQRVVNLARSTYNLPHDKAETLAAFLREHVKAKVLETKVEGDNLTITTTPETQKALEGLIALIQGKSAAADPRKPNTTVPDAGTVLLGGLKRLNEPATLKADEAALQLYLKGSTIVQPEKVKKP